MKTSTSEIVAFKRKYRELEDLIAASSGEQRDLLHAEIEEMRADLRRRQSQLKIKYPPDYDGEDESEDDQPPPDAPDYDAEDESEDDKPPPEVPVYSSGSGSGSDDGDDDDADDDAEPKASPELEAGGEKNLPVFSSGGKSNDDKISTSSWDVYKIDSLLPGHGLVEQKASQESPHDEAKVGGEVDDASRKGTKGTDGNEHIHVLAGVGGDIEKSDEIRDRDAADGNEHIHVLARVGGDIEKSDEIRECDRESPLLEDDDDQAKGGGGLDAQGTMEKEKELLHEEKEA